MKDPSLRDLARQYASCSLHLTEYRRARAELIQSILDDDETTSPLTQANYTAPMADDESRTETLTATARTLSSARITRELPPDPAPQSIRLGPDWRIPAAATTIIVVLLLIVGMVLFLGSEDEADPVTVKDPQHAPEPARPASSADTDNEAVALLEAFTSSPRWDQDSLDGFVEKWQGLPAEQREAALESPAARRLADMLNRQLVEERALRGSESETLEMIEQRTFRFAAEVGLQDRRLRSSQN